MPTELLRRYLQDAAQSSEAVQIALRGFAGGARTIQPTIARLDELLLVDPACQDRHGQPCQRHTVTIRIDPVLFRQAAVTEVPTLVLARDQDHTVRYSTISGDAQLTYLRETLLSAQGGTHGTPTFEPLYPTPSFTGTQPANGSDSAGSVVLPSSHRHPYPDYRPERLSGASTGTLPKPENQ